MKRKLLVAAVGLLAALVLCGLAFAETDPITCSMEVSPSSLSQPGEVTVTITISNAGETDMQNPVTLYSPTSEVVTDFGEQGSVTLKAGEVKTWTGKWDVNQRTLDNGQIVYFIKYKLTKADGTTQTQSQPIRGKLNATEAKADIEVKRTISPGTAREGQTVSVKYDIVNTGTVSLKNITIQENKDISKKSVSVAKELKAGETAQVKFPVTMGKKDLTSSATITYTSGDNNEKQTKTVAEQKITYGEAAMTAKLTSSSKGAEINGTVTLTLELKNKGSVNYTDLRVTDPTLGDVFTNQELAANATLKLEKEITLTQTTDYQFTITAIDNTGTEVSLATDALTLTAVEPGKSVHLNVTTAADRTEVYEQPGIVRFSITIENDSDVDATDVALYHGSTKIYTFASIPAGQTRKLTRDAALSMAGKYQFTAVTVDALGNSNKFASNEIQIAFSVPTPAPATPTPPLVPTPEPTYAVVTVPPISDPSVGTTAKLVRTFFYPLMIVGIILLAGVLVLLGIATKKRFEQKRASDAALDHLDRAKRRDYVAPNEEPEETPPAKPESKPSAKPAAAADTARAKVAETAESIADDVELPHMKYVRNAYERTGKAQTSDFGKNSLYDEDPLTGGANMGGGETEAYHTYGSDSDLYDVPSAAGQTKNANSAKDWSAYAKRPLKETAAPLGDDYVDYAQTDLNDQAADGNTTGAYPDAQATYGGYADYDQGNAAYAQDGSEYMEQDGYRADALGYGDAPAYADGRGSTGGYETEYAYDPAESRNADGSDAYASDQSTQSRATVKPEGGRRSRRSSEGKPTGQ